MARPRKIVANNRKHFTKEERAERLASEAAYKVPRTALENFDAADLAVLTEEARSEYKRLVELAHWLDDLDRNDLIAYCINFDRAARIAKNPDSQREVLAVTRADGSRKIIRNPLLQAWADCTAQMRAISLKLGLSQVDRLKLAAPHEEEEPENKFIRFLRLHK